MIIRMFRQPFIVVILATLFTVGKGVLFEVVHWNDINGQIESFRKGTSNSTAAPTPCPPSEITSCIGGIVNLAHYINEPGVGAPTFRLSSGNIIGGESGWLVPIGWERYGGFILEHLKPDIVALGMKEFGAGVSRTVTYMNATGNATLLTNTCIDTYYQDPEKQFCSTLINFKTIFVGSITIGVVGFVTPLVERLSLPGRLKFEHVVESINEVVSANPSIQIFIAVGDGPLDLAKEIVDIVAKVKLVIYGSAFSNTADMTENYPLEYNQGIIATAGRYGSSIGRLVLDVDSSGNLKVDARSRIVETVRPDRLNEAGTNAAGRMGVELVPPVDEDKSIIVGHSRVRLEGGEKCWREECNLGNLVTDAMVHCALVMAPLANPYPYPIHSIWHGGALFEGSISSSVNLTKFDIQKWLPFHNRAHLVSVTGRNLRQVFEESAGGIDPGKAGKNDWRQFLQVSTGIEVLYSTQNGIPQLSNVRMTHDVDGVPRMSDMEDDLDYYLVIPTYLYEGRGVYDFAKDFWNDVVHGNVPSNFAFDDECVEMYIEATKQVSVGFQERIWIDESRCSK